MSEIEQSILGEIDLEADGASCLAREQFDLLRELIHKEIGVTLSDTKRSMVAARLARRLRHLGLSSYREYVRYVCDQGPESPERQELINCITTNKTDFFRESHHFDFLRDVIFPQVQERARRGGPRRLRIWSAGCSTGEEPYTLAVSVQEAFPDLQDWDVCIHATDVDTDVLSRAARGIYEEERIEPIPVPVRHKYFLRGTGENAGFVCVRGSSRKLIRFSRLNLMDEPWSLHERFDAIFCRNVMIYFNRDTQERLVARFARQLNPGGHLFLGHSENIHGLSGLLRPLGATIYALTGDSHGASSRPSPGVASSRAAVAATPDLQERTLIVGDVVACDRPSLLKTLLGSCVSACLFDPTSGIGGMNHFSLPGESADDGLCTRYGVHAMELLINEIMKRGGDRRALQAKVFGGAKVLKVQSESLNIGSRNATFVLDFLQAEGIEVVAKCLGGTSGMRVHFYPHAGKVLQKPLDGVLLTEVARDEVRYSRDVLRRMSTPALNDVTLF